MYTDMWSEFFSLHIIKRYPFKPFLFHYDFMYVTFTITVSVIVLIFYEIASATCHKPGSLV